MKREKWEILLPWKSNCNTTIALLCGQLTYGPKFINFIKCTTGSRAKGSAELKNTKWKQNKHPALTRAESNNYDSSLCILARSIDEYPIIPYMCALVCVHVSIQRRVWIQWPCPQPPSSPGFLLWQRSAHLLGPSSSPLRQWHWLSPLMSGPEE